MTDLVFAGIAELAPRLAAKELSPVEVTEATLARIERLEPKLNAFITVTADSARGRGARRRGGDHGRRPSRAAARHPGRDQGPVRDPGRRHDLWLAAVRRLGARLRCRRGRAPEARRRGAGRQDQPARARLRLDQRECPLRAGAQPLAAGSSSRAARAAARRRRSPRAWPMPRWAATPAPRSASRPPAATSSGIKPTFGRVSKFGALPLAWSQDHAGPLTRTVRDAALVLQALAGHDPRDPTSVPRAVPDFSAAIERGVRGQTDRRRARVLLRAMRSGGERGGRGGARGARGPGRDPRGGDAAGHGGGVHRRHDHHRGRGRRLSRRRPARAAGAVQRRAARLVRARQLLRRHRLRAGAAPAPAI